MKTHFGKQLRRAREASGYTQKALSNLIGIDPNTLARIERGEQGMRWANLEKIIDVLHKPASYFFSNETPKIETQPVKQPDSMIDLIRLLAALNDSEVSGALALLKSMYPDCGPNKSSKSG